MSSWIRRCITSTTTSSSLAGATSAGNPQHITRRGQRQRMLAIGDVWRVDDARWREPISRRYYQVELEGGVDLVIFLDLVSGKWFEQRY